MTAVTLAQLLPDIQPYAPVRNHLLVRDFNETEGIFHLVNQAVAFCFEMDSVAVSHLSLAEMTGITEMLAQAIGNLPHKATITTTTYGSRIIKGDIAAYRNSGDPAKVNEVLAMLRERGIQQLQEGVDRPLLGAGNEKFMVKRITTIGCIMIQPTESVSLLDSVIDVGKEVWELLARPLGYKPAQGSPDAALLGELSPQQRRFHRQRLAMSRELLRASGRVVDALSNKGVIVRPLDPQGLIAHLRCLLQPNTGHQEQIVFDPMTEIYNQVATRDVEVSKVDGYVRCDGVYFKAASLSLAPLGAQPGMLSRPHEKLRRSILDYLDRGHITIAATMEDKDQVSRKATDLLSYGRSELCPPDRKERVIHEAIELGRHLDNGGTALSATITVVAQGDTPDEAERRINLVCDRLTTIDIPMRVEGREAPRFFFQSLPTNHLPPIKGAKRHKLITDKALAALWPVYGFGRGAVAAKRAQCVMPNRAGEPVRINLNASGSPHSVWTGMNGAGKSFASGRVNLSEFLMQPEGQVFVVDFNNSFGNFIGTMGRDGMVNNIGGKYSSTINPFRGSVVQVQEVLPAFLVALATPDGVPLSGSHLGKISEIISEAYKERRQDPIAFSDFNELYVSDDVFIHHARKRMVAKFIEHDLRMALNSVRKRSEGRPATFDVYYRYQITALALPDQEPMAVRQIGNIPPPIKEFLVDVKHCLLEQHSLEEPVVILSQLPDQAGLFATKGVQTTLDTEYVYVDVEQREDADEVQMQGVEFINPPEVAEVMIGRTLTRLREQPEYKDAADDDLLAVAQQQVASIQASEIYDYVQGEAVLQNEVFFSDWGSILDARADAGDEIAIDLRNRLSSYYGQGSNRGYFDGQTGFDLNTYRIIGFEMSEIAKATDHMKSIMICAVIQMIAIHCQTPSQRARPKSLFVDEAHRFLSLPAPARALAIAYREMRKFECSVHSASQTLEEYTNSEFGRVILNQAPNLFLLAQPKAAVEKAAKLLQLTPEQEAMYRSVWYKKGYFSEILWINDLAGICEVLVYVADPVYYWEFTSDGIDVDFRRRREVEIKAQFRGMSDQQVRVEAVTQLAGEFPNGYFHMKR